jgi:DNA polymerase-3 subunit gamma/tau
MAYEPLHHKYRPQTFAQLVGQDAIATTLTNALEQGKIAPAYLFTGARGTGKTSSARILAKSLNCLSSPRPTAQPCGVCDVCRAIANGSALDVIEIDAASNTGVDNIREVIERAQFAPVQCRHKVYVIDECHMLSASAFNALLKTLEEPPPHVVFVLATTDPQRVLPTIISRCQRFDFRRIPLEPMVAHLEHIVAQETIAITPDAVRLVAQLAQGGLRDAESLLDQLSLLPDTVTADKVWDLVGAVPERDLLALLQAITRDDATEVLDRARNLMDRGREPLVVLQNLAGFYRDLLIAKASPDRNDLVALTTDTWSELCAIAQSLTLAAILAGQQHLRTCELQVKNTAQPRLWLEVALLGLLPSAIPQYLDATHRGTTPTKNTTQPFQPSPTQSSSPQPSPPQPSSPQPSPQLDLSQIWQQVMLVIHPLTKGLLSDHGQLLAIQGNEVKIGINAEKLLKPAQGQTKNMEAAFKDVLGYEVKVTIAVTSQQDVSPEPLVPSTSSAPSIPYPASQSASTKVMEMRAVEPSTSPTATLTGSPVSTSKTMSSQSGSQGSQSEPQPASAVVSASPTVPALPSPPLPPRDHPIPPLSPASVVDSAYSQDKEEVQRSAKNFAEWFNGVVVDFEQDNPQQVDTTDTNQWADVDVDVEDVPF